MDAGTPVRRAARIRLLVADVDGTLTNSRHEVAEATCRVVDRLRTAGVRVMLATGRRYRDTLPVQERLGIDDAPLVTASGALVKRPTDHATLWRAAFATGVLGRVLRRIVAAGHEPVVYTDDFAAGRDFHCRSLAGAEPGGGGLAEYLHRHRDLADVRPDLDVAPPAGAFAGFTMGSRDAMLALEADLAATFPGALATHVIKSPRYREWLCELAPAGTHDGTGIADVAELILAGLAQPAPLGGAGSRSG